jgi:hypothetical protein
MSKKWHKLSNKITGVYQEKKKFPILWCSQSSNPQQKNLAKFSYRPSIKVKKFRNPIERSGDVSKINQNLVTRKPKKNQFFLANWLNLATKNITVHLLNSTLQQLRMTQGECEKAGVLSQILLNRIRATLDEGPGTNEFKQFYWSKALNWCQAL